MKFIMQCLFSPRLFKVYREGSGEALYQPQGPEKWGDKVLSTANIIMNISLYTSPFICMYIYKRGFFTLEEAKALGRFLSGIGCLLVASLFLRAYGRSTNPKYKQFLKVLTTPITDKTEYLNGIRKYDFEFESWPVTYSMTSKERDSWLSKNPFRTTANENLPLYQRTFIQILAFIATHTFGLRLIYPGSMSLVQMLMWDPLFQGRAQLVEKFDGQRSKLLTSDGNTVDTMFVDKRFKTPDGLTLVVCCEGNSGFYELGIMTTPVKAGFSALGWNHPGFAGSSGLPYPSQEHNAIDAVMQYAIEELGFQPHNIVLFGWSIGGYVATWTGLNYPIKALILDATFDDLLPLAENQMPASWSLLVKEVVRSYVNLNIADLLVKYDGPVRLIRRTEDEIICLRQGDLATNRGNFLLIRLLEHRYSEILDNEESRATLHKLVSMSQNQREALDKTDMDLTEKALISLINKFMYDFKSTHCAPLRADSFASVMENI